MSSGLRNYRWRRLGLAFRFLRLLSGSSCGSKLRNLTSFSTLAFVFGLVLLIFNDLQLDFGKPLAWIAVLWAFVFFYYTVIGVAFLVSKRFIIDPVRLARDVLFSTMYTISAFALLFKQYGIVDSSDPKVEPANADYLYFSAVTFSTLGYGDFKPAPGSRLFAALEALFGNLHLGLIAGGIYLIVSEFRSRK